MRGTILAILAVSMGIMISCSSQSNNSQFPYEKAKELIIPQVSHSGWTIPIWLGWHAENNGHASVFFKVHSNNSYEEECGEADFISIKNGKETLWMYTNWNSKDDKYQVIQP